jgi:phenylalanyl-tRNA synthetase beta chain
MHPGRCASVSVGGKPIGFVGELHPQWRQGYDLAQAPMLFELELDAVLQRPVPEFKPVSKLQPVERDIAVIVAESVTHAALMGAIHGAATQGLLKGATLFDVYRPQQASASMQMGEKSLAVRLVLSSDAATLTDEEIEAAVQAVLANLQASSGRVCVPELPRKLPKNKNARSTPHGIFCRKPGNPGADQSTPGRIAV